MKICFDMSSVIQTCLKTGVDIEGSKIEHNGKMVQVNTAAYGYEFAINLMVKAFNDTGTVPSDAILVFEGKDSKRKRCMIDPTYKANRGKGPPEEYLQFNDCKTKVKDVFKRLGAICVQQDSVEGDDVLGWLAEHSEEDLTIVTNDGDMLVLNGVNKHGAKIEVRLNKETGVNKYGAFDFKLITLYKALVGDTNDNIKGVPGFGPAKWLDLNFAVDDDGCFELMDLISKGKRDEVASLARDNDVPAVARKLLQMISDNWDAATKSLKLAKIHPEWVHTPRAQLEWEPGMVHGEVNDERLKKWAAKQWLVTADNYEEMYEGLAKRMSISRDPAFDIETSSCDESDDWLEAQGKPDGVDQLGSTLTGFSITFGRNSQNTYYVSVDHKDSKNITMSQARKMIELQFTKNVVIQNTFFELSVLHEAQDEDGSYWRDHWKKYGEKGMIPNIRDTKLEGSYVNENMKLGLKDRSKIYLGYDQTSYDTVTIKTGVGLTGGRLIKTDAEGVEIRQYKMNELTAEEAYHYGADDTITTSALHNFYKLHMQLDHHWGVYLETEIDAAYIHAKSFVDGMPVSIAKSKQLEKKDDAVYDAAWGTLRAFLIEQGWAGTVPPVYTAAITAKEIKEAYAIVTGQDSEDEDDSADEDGEKIEKPVVKDIVLSSRVRIPAKLAILVDQAGQEELAKFIAQAIAGKPEALTEYVQSRFTGEPKFKASPKQLGHLMYDIMKVPIRLRGKVTATMKAKGIREGNPKANELAIKYAMKDGTADQKSVLEALVLMKMVSTRRGLYYSKYPGFVHWKTGRIHGSHNQCATNTRRASESGPNKTQLPKNMKVEGHAPEYRQVIVPHKKNAVIVSMDFEQQELKVIADYSQDPNMLACYIGDDKKDMHLLTATGIVKKKFPKDEWDYAKLSAAREDETDANHKFAKEWRGKGKTTNFATEYGAEAEKISQTLMIDEDEAQIYIDAKRETFAVAEQWKEDVKDEAKVDGFVRTKLGAMRHLAELLNSDDRFIASKAERQAVNFKIQSSGAEMTKKAEGRMWRANLLENFDCVYIGPVHDEVVWSVDLDDLYEWAKVAHPCMIAQYADMKVPVTSSISFGPDFGRQIEIGAEVTEEAFAEGRKKLAEMLEEA